MTMEPVEVLYRAVIENAITQHPRSLQKRIGPSEIGLSCDRRILYKLAQVPEPPRPPAWKPTIGTATHDYLERQFDAANNGGGTIAGIEWVTEWEVTVGTIGDTPITGHSDLFHVPSGTVIDHKIIGPKQLTKYRLHGPSEQYKVQAMLYAKGFTDGDEWGPAKRVAISFLPRDGELGQAYWWEAAYDPHIAGAALLRLHQLDQLLGILGIDDAIKTKPHCDDEWCPWCRTSRPQPPRASVFDAGRGPVTRPTAPQQSTLTLPGLGLPQPQPRRSIFD